MNPNELRDKIFLMLDKRFREIVQEKQKLGMPGSFRAFHDSIPEWNQRLRSWGVEVADVQDETVAYRYFREAFSAQNRGGTFLPRDPQLVSDPCHELGLRLGILKDNHRWLKLDEELAMKILALGLP